VGQKSEKAVKAFSLFTALFSNGLPGATAVQDGTRASNAVCSLPEVCTINSLEHKSGEICSGTLHSFNPACKTGKAAPWEGEVAKVFQRTSSPCFVILGLHLEHLFWLLWGGREAGEGGEFPW